MYSTAKGVDSCPGCWYFCRPGPTEGVLFFSWVGQLQADPLFCLLVRLLRFIFRLFLSRAGYLLLALSCLFAVLNFVVVGRGGEGVGSLSYFNVDLISGGLSRWGDHSLP